MAFTGFGPRAVDFFAELGEHNERAWWLAQHDRYVREVADPLAELAAELREEFGPAHLFRPHRDVRFSRDKRPYKEQASFAAGEGSERAGGGSLYLQLSADGLLVGGGWWHPEPGQLAAFRAAVDRPQVAADLHRLLAELHAAGLELDEGEPLATAPRGWPRDHPQIALLRRRRVAVMHHLAPGPWLGTRQVLDVARRDWRAVARLVTWLEENAASA